MKEPLKIWLFGLPFTGKTYWASQFPKPLILSTDGNARFYADRADFKKISNLHEFNTAVNDVIKGDHEYETIVLDVTEHLYEYVREYYLDKNNVDDESEIGGYALGWRVIRGAFWTIIQKLANTDYNVIFISHEETDVSKDPLGRETYYHRPALGNEKLRTQVSGIMQFVGRAVVEETEINGEIVKKHYLSFGSQSNEMSGQRIPLKSLKFENTYEAFIENLEW